MHSADPGNENGIDDQLYLVKALEISHLRLIAGIDKRFESGPDQFAQAPAEDHLLAEEIGLGLLPETGFNDTGPGAADGLRMGERQLQRPSRGVLMNGHEARDSAAFHKLRADERARAFGRHHVNIDFLRRLDVTKMNVKPVRKKECLTRF